MKLGNGLMKENHFRMTREDNPNKCAQSCSIEDSPFVEAIISLQRKTKWNIADFASIPVL